MQSGEQRLIPLRRLPPMAPLFASNRRDGSRLLSFAVVVFFVALVRIDTAIGRIVAASSALISVYCWICYKRLDH